MWKHPATERHGPPAPGRLRLRCRRDGIAAQLVTHHFQAHPAGTSLSEDDPSLCMRVARQSRRKASLASGTSTWSRGLVLPRPLVVAALLVAMAGARVAKPSRSDAIGALAADVTTWTITGRGASEPDFTDRLVRPRSRYPHRSSDALALTRENVVSVSVPRSVRETELDHD